MAVTAGLFEIPADFDPAELLSGVDAAERDRYASLERRPQRARQYLASRWLLRAHLGFELGLQPQSVPLRDSRGGPPVLRGSACHLSLSHSGNCCLCIVAPRLRVGCDVELQRPRTRARAIAAAYFDPAETRHLESVSAARAQHDFYRLWTLKEAAQKALGRGLDGGLHSPAFTLAPALRCLHAPAGGAWTFASCHIAHADRGRHAMALAMLGASGPVPFSVATYTATAGRASRHDCRLCWAVTT